MAFPSTVIILHYRFFFLSLICEGIFFRTLYGQGDFMRKLGISGKLYGNALLVLVMILSMGAIIFKNLLNIEKAAKEMTERDKYASICLEREIDHLKWEARLETVFLEKKLHVDIQTDHKLCELGKFIYGKDGQLISSRDKIAANIITSMEEPHKNLHDSAISIFNVLAKIEKDTTEKEADLIRNEAYIIFKGNTSPALTQLQSKLHALGGNMKTKNAEARKKLFEAVRISIASLVIITLAAIVVSLILNVLTAKSIISPISQISKTAQLIASGNIYSAKLAIEKLASYLGRKRKPGSAAIHQSDEISILITSITSMTENLNSLVSQVQKSIIQTATSALQIASSSKEQEVTVTEVSVSTSEIATSSEEIAATSRQIVISMNGVAASFNHTAEFASRGNSNLNEMHLAMKQLAAATESIYSKLSTINERGKLISDVVVTMTKITDQTNLLSLNAAIEAEKAGEYGKGFSVVAKEIRRLADQTAIATLDIAKIVKDMQSAVSSGVMEMDKFSEDVRKHVSGTSSTISHIEAIMKEIQSIHSIFNNVVEESKQQAEGAKQITEAIVQLSDAARQAAESLREFNEATRQLNNTTQTLRKEISIFNIGTEQDS